jgi:predicted MFS family arabinose efflux permease
LIQQGILNGMDWSWPVRVKLDAVPYPWNFACIFGATIPLMGAAAFLSTKFVVPEPVVEPERQPLCEVIFGGLREYLSYRVILLTIVAYILVASGFNIMNNISLYTKDLFGALAEKYIGFENALRFGFKVVVGLSLGWLLTKTHAKAGLIVTASFLLAAVLWVLFGTGNWFLLSFGLMGAGELFGVYFPNYVLACSAKSKMRRNMALTSLLRTPAMLAPYAYGAIADIYSLRASFWIAAGILLATLLIILFGLPADPRPRRKDMTESDLLDEAASGARVDTV